MKCRELYSFLDDFLDGHLDVATRQNFERHLELCVSCRRYLATYQTTLKVARGAERADELATANAPEGLVLAILAARAVTFLRQPPE